MLLFFQMQLLRNLVGREKLIIILFYSFAICLLFSIAGQYFFIMVLSIILFGKLLGRLKKGGKFSLRLDGFERPLLAVLASVLLSFMFGASFFPVGSGDVVLSAMRWMALLYISYYALESVKIEKNEKYIQIFFTVATVVAAYSIFQFVTGIDIIRYPKGPHAYGTFGYRVTGFFNNPMTYGHIFAMMSCLSYGYLIHRFRVRRKILDVSLLFFLLILISTLLTMTRGAYIATAAGILVVSLFSGRNFFLLTLFSIIIAVMAMMLSSPIFMDRLSSIFSTEGSSAVSRIEIWKTYLLIFRDYPWFGYGAEMVTSVLKDYYLKQNISNGQVGHAHNNYVNILANSGIVGLLSYLYLFLYAIYRNVKSILKLRSTQSLSLQVAIACMGAQIAFHVGGLSECTFLDTEIRNVFLFVIILSLIAAKNYENLK